MAIINKNDPAREDHVNAVLYDSADFFKRSMHTPLESGEEFTDDVEFRDAVSHKSAPQRSDSYEADGGFEL